MTDSRAALEERAAKFLEERWIAPDKVPDDYIMLSDFAEQESSSLKLLLSAICRGKAEVFVDTLIIFDDTLLIDAAGQFPVELDSSGIPVLTREIMEALEATK